MRLAALALLALAVGCGPDADAAPPTRVVCQDGLRIAQVDAGAAAGARGRGLSRLRGRVAGGRRGRPPRFSARRSRGASSARASRAAFARRSEDGPSAPRGPAAGAHDASGRPSRSWKRGRGSPSARLTKAERARRPEPCDAAAECRSAEGEPRPRDPRSAVVRPGATACPAPR